MIGHGRRSAGARSGRDTVRRRGARERRILVAALALSAILHVLALGTIGDLLRGPRTAVAPPSPLPTSAPPVGMRVVRVSPTAAPSAVERDRPERPERVQAAEPPRRQARRAAPAVAVEQTGRAGAADDL